MKEKNGRNRGVSRESTRRDLDASKRSSGLSLATRITQRLLRHDGVAGVVAGSSTDVAIHGSSLCESFIGSDASMLEDILVRNATARRCTHHGQALRTKSRVHGGATGPAVKDHPNTLCFRSAQAQVETLEHGHVEKYSGVPSFSFPAILND
jgi:hypothetical protein